MALTTLTQVAAPVNVVYQKTLLDAAVPECHYYVGSTPATVTEHAGSYTAKWRRYENMTPVSAALSELSSDDFPTRTGSQPSITDVTKAVSKYGDFIRMTEEVDLVNVENVNVELMRVMGRQAGRSLNNVQRDELEDNSTIIQTAAEANDAAQNNIITTAEIRQAVNTLNRAYAMPFTAQTNGSSNIGTTPTRPAFWAFTHSDVEEDIRDFTGFVPVENYASQTDTKSGEFGAYNGVRFLSSPEASIDDDVGAVGGTDVRETTNSKADLYTTVIIGENYHGSLGLKTGHIKTQYSSGDKLPAVQVISKTKGSAGAADPLDELSTVGWKTWAGAKIFNANFGIAIRSAASTAASLS